jgi:uncharacterized metal-binding protein YceD (DUF177 family)
MTEVNELRAYDINIAGLENKRYEFDFSAGKAFFQTLEQQLIGDGTIQTHLTLDKSETMIRLDFQIKGTVEQICDRSLDSYNETVDTHQTLYLKFSDRNEELTDEIELIERNTHAINVARYIFDYIALALPMKRLHPRFRDEDEADEESEGKLIYSSGPANADKADDETPAVDPRWEALRKLSNN